MTDELDYAPTCPKCNHATWFKKCGNCGFLNDQDGTCNPGVLPSALNGLLVCPFCGVSPSVMKHHYYAATIRHKKGCYLGLEAKEASLFICKSELHRWAKKGKLTAR